MMAELFLRAWEGWLQFTSAGKLAAPLLASILFLWLCGKAVSRAQKELLAYTMFMTACCICPVTAAALMWYQTRFYDYQWVWSLVPMTGVTAWATAWLLGEQWRDFHLTEWKRGLPVTVLLLAVLLLCGNMGRTSGEEDGGRAADRQQAAEVLARVRREFPEGEICLWAPRKIMEYARQVDPSVKLAYGRNLWDESLNAYAYDVYPREAGLVYVWMERAVWNVVDMEEEESRKALPADGQRADRLEETEQSADGRARGDTGKGTEEERMPGQGCVRWALSAGVNCILLPGNLSPEVVEELSEIFDGNVTQLEGYYLLTR